MNTHHSQSTTRPGTALTVSELATLLGIRQQIIRRLVRLELIQPVQCTPDLRFTAEVVPRVRRLVRLHYQLEVSWSSMSLVLDLLDRIDELETRLHRSRT